MHDRFACTRSCETQTIHSRWVCWVLTDDVPRGQVWDDMVSTFIPLGRAGTGEDVANMVVFLCSEQGAWVTGQQIYVDGGHGATPRRPDPN